MRSLTGLSLPIDPLIPELLQSLRKNRNLVLEAPAGAGKTTRVPPALLGLDRDQVVVLEPRRMAARMAARRVAFELGELPGETAGYHVRFDEEAGPRTRLRFVTPGVLTRRLLSDPALETVSTVVLDEFHERNLETDVALALLRRLQMTSRPDLRLLVMSATLNAAPIAAYLDGCPVLRSEGRLFPVAIGHTPHSSAPLEDQVAQALDQASRQGLDGDILVFLPGAVEIRRAARSCEVIARSLGLRTFSLYGDLSPEEQDDAIRPAAFRKLILSTNVAESSITIEGVTLVIDSGLARVASDSPWTGLPALNVQRISKASAAQRAGRAGRVRPGRVIRLYSLDDFVRRPDHDVPEIQRRELSQTLLELEAMGVACGDLPWFEPPPGEAVEKADDLLSRLGAVSRSRELTRYPLHPRLARVLLEAPCAETCRIAAALSAGERYASIDAMGLLDGDVPGPSAQVARQLRQLLRGSRQVSDEGIRKALLTGYPDRVAKRRSPREVQLSGGQLAAFPADWRSEFLVALDLEDRRDQPMPLIRLACAIEPEWLIDLFPDQIVERDEVVWNRAAERAERWSAILYDGIVLQESRSGDVDPEQASDVLAAKVLEAGLERFFDIGDLDAFRARLEFAALHASVPELNDDLLRLALRELCYGLKSFAEARTAIRTGLIAALERRFPAGTLNRVAPERVPLKGRQVKVNYAAGQPPWIAARLQDFFGMHDTPRIAMDRVPLVVHLLAPNHRPVQMTTDLAGFWKRLYPQVRRELMRRYPKHQWPEDPG